MEETIKIWTDEELIEELIERRNVINTRIERLHLLQKRVELIESECKKRGLELPIDESAALPLHGVMHCPDWLHDNHKAEAIRLYKIRKVDGVKYLTDIARKHLVNPLKWSYDFLKGCA